MSFREDWNEASTNRYTQGKKRLRDNERERERERGEKEEQETRREKCTKESDRRQILNSLTCVRYAIGSTFRTWSYLSLSIDSTLVDAPRRALINVSSECMLCEPTTDKLSNYDRAFARKPVPSLYRCEFVHNSFKDTFDPRSKRETYEIEGS